MTDASQQTDVPQTYLTDEVRLYIGRAGRLSAPFRVDAWGARRYAEATNDANPRYGYGQAPEGQIVELLAPPTLLGQNIPDLDRLDPPLAVPHATGLVGSLEWEFVRPILVGETVTAQMLINDIYEKRGRLGLMVFVEHETVFRDQDSAVVARFRVTRIRY